MMRTLWLFSMLLLGTQAATSQPALADGPSTVSNGRPLAPPVLRNADKADTGILTLPMPQAVIPVVPAQKATPVPAMASIPLPPPVQLGRPMLARLPFSFSDPLMAKTDAAYPEQFKQDMLGYLQQHISRWTRGEARQSLGPMLRERTAFGDDGRPNGIIQAYADPTGAFKEFELDFDSKSGSLRTVFIYPQGMTWQECRKLYGGKVSEADAAKGRRFFSYLDRRMDVLVDATGKVISFGLY